MESSQEQRNGEDVPCLTAMMIQSIGKVRERTKSCKKKNGLIQNSRKKTDYGAGEGADNKGNVA